jgi:hypothetical protein
VPHRLLKVHLEQDQQQLAMERAQQEKRIELNGKLSSLSHLMPTATE